jgi:hypothetical protein
MQPSRHGLQEISHLSPYFTAWHSLLEGVLRLSELNEVPCQLRPTGV